MGEIVDQSTLRICADPGNWPFSTEHLDGFENRIAELLGRELGVPVAYTWFPQATGFVRNTLRARRCDLILGVVTTDELVQNTNPYYRSSYVLVHRAGEGDRFGDVDSPLFQLARIGVVAGTPPADLLLRRGRLATARSYQLMTDARVRQPALDMLADLAAGEIDIALVWGPIAGAAIRRRGLPLEMVILPSDPRAGLRMDFRISMGVRHAEPVWKETLNELIRRLQPEITAILQEFGVPLLDNRGRLIEAALPNAGEWRAAVPEPRGYRTDHYRAPVPATLDGVTVVDAMALVRLIETERPLLVDVLPKARRPPGRDPAALWIEPRREHIPGSVWLPNVGLGVLPDDLMILFERELKRLTGGDRGRPVVFYCDADCWMSWNAAKRARHELGYGRVYWYPDGVEGWVAAGHDLVPATTATTRELVN